jgi:long-chain acyl-CoA synthetase
MSLNLVHFVDVAAEEHPNKVAVKLDAYQFTYAELVAISKQVAHGLRATGIGPGDKVAMMLPNTPHFSMVYYGILRTGATVVPINVLLRQQEIVHHLDDSDAKVCVYWKDFEAEVLPAFAEVETCHNLIVCTTPGDLSAPPGVTNFMAMLAAADDDFDTVQTMPDDTAVILYTSGTTGQPKGAELTHFNVFFNALCVRDYVIGLKSDDVAIAILPLFHSFGQTCIQNAALITGATVTMLPRFETVKTLEVIQRDKVTILAAVPTMYYFLLDHPDTTAYDIASLRLAVSGGAAISVDMLGRFKKQFGIEILEGYGLSETSPVASFNIPTRPAKPGSIGLPIWGCEMAVKRDDGTFADVDQVGEIVIRGHNIMKGYYKREVATQDTIVNGWFHSGDIGKRDADGYYYIVDRKKDLIIRGGMNIYPREIEEFLYGHPAILEVAIVGVPDPIRGEEVKAFISLRQGASVTPDELREYCSQHLARYKCPTFVEILPELPKGPTGKILKRELRLEKMHTEETKTQNV